MCFVMLLTYHGPSLPPPVLRTEVILGTAEEGRDHDSPGPRINWPARLPTQKRAKDSGSALDLHLHSFVTTRRNLIDGIIWIGHLIAFGSRGFPRQPGPWRGHRGGCDHFTAWWWARCRWLWWQASRWAS